MQSMVFQWKLENQWILSAVSINGKTQLFSLSGSLMNIIELKSNFLVIYSWVKKIVVYVFERERERGDRKWCVMGHWNRVIPWPGNTTDTCIIIWPFTSN